MQRTQSSELFFAISALQYIRILARGEDLAEPSNPRNGERQGNERQGNGTRILPP